MRKFIVSVLGLGFLGVASTATYYSFNSSENEIWKQWTVDLKKTKILAETIKDKVKDLSGKQDLKDLSYYFSNLESFEKYDKNDPTIELETTLPGVIKTPETNEKIVEKLKNKIMELKEKIKESKEKVSKKNTNSLDLEEIYKEIKKGSFLIAEILGRKYKLIKKINELNSKVSEDLRAEITKINEEILKEDFLKNFKNIENLKEKISEKKQEIEKKLENNDFKNLKEEEVQKWLHLNIKNLQSLVLLNILVNVFNDVKN